MLSKQRRESLEAVARTYESFYESIDEAPPKTQRAWSRVLIWLEADREKRAAREERRRQKRLAAGGTWHN